MEVYNDKLKNIDESIKKFVEIVNQYFVNKYIEYDEKDVTLYIYDKKEEILDMEKLSSGEKQMLSIFAKLYLSSSKDYTIIFDEPELSLSVEWQEKFLVDIVDSKKCKFLFVVTHSPFIFNNKLKNYAVGLNLYMEEI